MTSKPGVTFYIKKYNTVEETNSQPRIQPENTPNSRSTQWEERIFTSAPLRRLSKNPLSNPECTACNSVRHDQEHSIRHGLKAVPRSRIQDVQNGGLAGCLFCSILFAAIKQYSLNVLKREVASLNEYCHLNGATRSDSWWEWAVRYPNPRGSNVCTSNFEIFTTVRTNGGPWSFLKYRGLVHDPTSPEFCRLITKSLDIASQDNDCLPKSSIRPSRVLDIRQEGLNLDIRLAELPSDGSRYAALSHCWGRHQPIRTLRSNLANFQENISWGALPLLFQQAITLGRRLQLDYIWIDSLCIVQDDDSDWAAEASIMGDIYHNAYITLMALEAEDSTKEMLPSPPKQLLLTELPSLPSGDRSPLWVRERLEHYYMSPYGEPGKSPLFSRAWTFQELFLSRNAIGFAPQELIWQSPEVRVCDCLGERELFPWVFDRIIGQLEGNDKQTRADRDSYWHYKILRNFLDRNITYDTDRLPALSGIAKAFLITHPGVYVAGLWTEQLPLSLLWRLHPRKWGASGRVPGVPTWSWASVAGTWRYAEPPTTDVVCTGRVIGVSCKFKHTDATGAVDGGSITFKGRTVTAQLKFMGPNTVPRAWLVRNGTIANADVDLRYDDGSEECHANKVKYCYIPSPTLAAAIVGLPSNTSFNREVTCIEIARGPNFDKISSMDMSFDKVKKNRKIKLWRNQGIWGLVLLPSKSVPGQFERLGVSWMPSGWFRKALVREVVIM